MQAENNPTPVEKPAIEKPSSIGSHSRWKRNVAIAWVIFLCLVGGAGLALAGVFSSSKSTVSGY